MKKIILIISLFFRLLSVAQSTYTVTSLIDDNSVGTLRTAINTANSNSTINEIVFSAGLIGKITLTSNLPNIKSSYTITGPGTSIISISGNSIYKMFTLDPSVVLTITSLTLTENSKGTSTNPGTIFYAFESSVLASDISITGNTQGYAFYAGSDNSLISFTNSTFTNNSGNRFITSDFGSTPDTTSDNDADYTNKIIVTGCTFSNNSGMIFFVERYVKLDNCIFDNNSGLIGNFRGVNRFQVLNSTFTNNTGATLFSFSSWISSEGWGLTTLGTNHHLFDGNLFTDNSGIVINTGSVNDQSKTTIINNVFSNNGTEYTGSPIVNTNNTLGNFFDSVLFNSSDAKITVTMNRAVFNTNTGSGELQASDFRFSFRGSYATLQSITPTSISSKDNIYTLGLDLSGDIYGTETISLYPITNSIYDINSNIAGAVQKNNTTLLNFNISILSSAGEFGVNNTNSYVNKNGKIGSGSGLTKYGKIITVP
ncbi:autotransporter outer membrane beta-barrel domain-containing protein [Flavobacterium frigoris]|uniref:Right handed beta helix domain-containing protein n=1 Tax=Flavobacterium frigoris TaxID=229204 RepID=A0A1H9PWE2_FLAFI|nr:hypothetical protein [Flavobacterium frigoris]SER52470.1 hypothetical protein SAMN05444355_11470 [Flavobacterium frigoris]